MIPKLPRKEEKKFEEEEKLKPEKKKKRLFNQFIIFLLHIIFCFLILTHPKLFLYACKIIFVCILNFYHHEN